MGAEITATNTGTGAKRVVTTSATGDYRFDLLPAGKYSVQISKKGFGTSSQSVELLVGQTNTSQCNC